jgi:hypothetical protein
MSDKKKSEQKNKQLDDKRFIYRLEIAYNEKTGVVEYITESICQDEPAGPIDTNFDYLEDYWDKETLELFNHLYLIGEA